MNQVHAASPARHPPADGHGRTKPAQRQRRVDRAAAGPRPHRGRLPPVSPPRGRHCCKRRGEGRQGPCRAAKSICPHNARMRVPRHPTPSACTAPCPRGCVAGDTGSPSPAQPDTAEATAARSAPPHSCSSRRARNRLTGRPRPVSTDETFPSFCAHVLDGGQRHTAAVSTAAHCGPHSCLRAEGRGRAAGGRCCRRTHIPPRGTRCDSVTAPRATHDRDEARRGAAATVRDARDSAG